MPALLVLLLLILPAQLLADEIYRTVDSEGNVIFSDAPPPNSATERVEVMPTNTTPPPVEISRPEATPEPVADPGPVVTIIEPADETSLPMGPGNFSVSATVEPALEEDQVLQLFIDGTPWGEPQSEAEWQLTNVYRGQHDLTVGVIDNAGETVARSNPVRVFVHRPSSNFRAR